MGRLILFIHEMRLPPAEFFRYLPTPPDASVWGLAVTAGGYHVQGPGMPYPPPGHPSDHRLTWTNGRVLGAWQIVVITAGKGRFESANHAEQVIDAGTALCLFPGIWHRYAPDPLTGWSEMWLELQGPVLRNLQDSDVWSPDQPISRPTRAAEATALIKRILHRMRDSPGFDAETSALALQVLALLCGEPRRNRDPESLIHRAVGRAETLLAAQLEDPPGMPALARELGVAYSYFRREFKVRTGLAPKRYLLRLRLEKARRLLGNSPDSIKVIADRLGFSSAFHLSAAFKREFGVSPSAWRKPDRTGPIPPKSDLFPRDA